MSDDPFEPGSEPARGAGSGGNESGETDPCPNGGSSPPRPGGGHRSDDGARSDESDLPESNHPDDGRSLSPVSLALERFRRDPGLLLPFLIAGVCLAVLDWLRRLDPLPTRPAMQNGAPITVAYTGYPTGAPETARALESLIDLKLPYLVWGIGLEAVAVLVIAAAGTVTIARALPGDRGGTTGRRLLAYGGLVVLFDGAFRVLASFIDGDVGLVFGLVLIVPLFAIFVRLFAAPAAVVTGSGPVTALRQSAAPTRGRGWTILALVIGFGLAAWLLGRVPRAGTVVSTALVGSLHAVTVAVLWEVAVEERGRGD